MRKLTIAIATMAVGAIALSAAGAFATGYAPGPSSVGKALSRNGASGAPDHTGSFVSRTTFLEGTAGVRSHVAGAKPRPKPLLQRLVDGLVHDGAPGALAVVRTPTRIRRAASGLAERGPKVTLRATDRFRIASLTKSFVATVVLQLVAEGKMRLDDTVEHWLPGLVPNGSAITIRELLNHTSGLYSYSDDPDSAPGCSAIRCTTGRRTS
jgi:CubicO group peptidase (beta-lactamase class C family)